MRQISSKKFLLIAVFALFSIVSTGLNYCFGWSKCEAVITHPELKHCPYCANELKEVCEIWFDQVYFHIHTYQCSCGFWDVYYN